MVWITELQKKRELYNRNEAASGEAHPDEQNRRKKHQYDFKSKFGSSSNDQESLSSPVCDLTPSKHEVEMFSTLSISSSISSSRTSLESSSSSTSTTQCSSYTDLEASATTIVEASEEKKTKFSENLRKKSKRLSHILANKFHVHLFDSGGSGSNGEINSNFILFYHKNMSPLKCLKLARKCFI